MSAPSDKQAAKLREWTLAAYSEMVAAGYITPPWSPTDEIAEKLEGYFKAKMTPAEAATAAFATYH